MEITSALFAAVKSLAKRENCSVSMVILAALSVLLYSYTNQRDIRIGTLVANRRCSETESLFGHFLNTVVIRTLISPGMTCAQLLKEVRATMIESYAHQDLPFEKLAQVLEEERNVSTGLPCFRFFTTIKRFNRSPHALLALQLLPFRLHELLGPLEAPITGVLK